jgi:hypothetical protein
MMFSLRFEDRVSWDVLGIRMQAFLDKKMQLKGCESGKNWGCL